MHALITFIHDFFRSGKLGFNLTLSNFQHIVCSISGIFVARNLAKNEPCVTANLARIFAVSECVRIPS